MADLKIQLPEGVPPLNTYYAYLTGGCNLACQHCWISPSYQASGGDGGHLDFDLFALAIEEGLPMGLRSVKLTGGEPLLHPDFVRIVDFLKAKNINVTIETNGTLLSEELACYLKEQSTIQFISVSLDGATPETHDAFRGVKGCFEKACQAIRYLAKVGYHPQVIMSIHSGNVNEVGSLVHLAENLGATSVKFNLIQSAGRGGALAKRGKLLNIQRLIEIGNWIEKDLQSQVTMPLIYGWPIAFKSIKKLVNSEGIGTCTILNILGILPSGYLAMCGIGIQVPDLLYGLLGKDSIYDIWTKNSTLLDLRKKIPSELEGVCSLCILQGDCLGSCIAENYFTSQHLTAPFWFCQLAYEECIFPQTRLHLTEDTNHIHIDRDKEMQR